MLLGQNVTCPKTGKRGSVVQLVGPYAYAQAVDKTTFRVPRSLRPGGRKPIYGVGMAVQVLPPEGKEWVAGEVISVAPLRVKVTGPDPIWQGAELATSGGCKAKVRAVA